EVHGGPGITQRRYVRWSAGGASPKIGNWQSIQDLRRRFKRLCGGGQPREPLLILRRPVL
ncbi:MAG TPA: hypothetical protein VK852_02340, partial [Desulfobacterales bacterium]|nr:hypothetical protein [Desulfobacterales bacterium]